MATTYYYSANGEMYGESTGGVMTTYMTDALGSTIGTFQNAAVVNSYSYSPYGGQISKAGIGPDPRFLWNGGNEYSSSGRAYSTEYVKLRHFDASHCVWTTTDGQWPEQAPYAYAASNPSSIFDPTGGAACRLPCNPEEIDQCKAGCASKGWNYKDCDWFFGAFDCTCEPKPCPKPCLSSAAANLLAMKQMVKAWGPKCNPSKKGKVGPATCEGGTHQTLVFSCTKGTVSISIRCCPCLTPAGAVSECCTENVHLSGS